MTRKIQCAAMTVKLSNSSGHWLNSAESGESAESAEFAEANVDIPEEWKFAYFDVVPQK